MIHYDMIGQTPDLTRQSFRFFWITPRSIVTIGHRSIEWLDWKPDILQYRILIKK